MTKGAIEPDRGGGEISTRAAPGLAWSLWAVSLALLVAVVTISQDFPSLLLVLLAVGLAAYPTVGALVASRRPANAVGWLLCVVGLTITSSIFTEEYASYARQTQPGPLPGAEVATYLLDMNPGVVGLAILVPLLFPELARRDGVGNLEWRGGRVVRKTMQPAHVSLRMLNPREGPDDE